MLETKVIPIEYDEETKQQAEELKTIIENNPMLFQMFLAGHKKISFLENIDDETLGIDSLPPSLYTCFFNISILFSE